MLIRFYTFLPFFLIVLWPGTSPLVDTHNADRVTVTNILASPAYCNPKLNCADRDMITNVKFRNLNNNSTCGTNGYTDFTNLPAVSVAAGNSYPMLVTVGDGWSNEAVSVWIDYNDNGTFERGEFTFLGVGSGSVVSDNINIPSDASSGLRRMRVRVAAVGASAATWDLSCDEDDEYGETEDYMVDVIAGTLPVSLGSFTVTALGRQTLLKWQTLSEYNSDSFVIYRSGSDGQFAKIGEQKGAGNSTTSNTYSFYDKLPFNGLNYYRLVQQDHNGKQTEIGEKAIEFKLATDNEFSVFPNPATTLVSIKFGEHISEVRLIDPSGRVIASAKLAAKANTHSFNVDKLPAGIYFIKLYQAAGTKTVKFVKL